MSGSFPNTADRKNTPFEIKAAVVNLLVFCETHIKLSFGYKRLAQNISLNENCLIILWDVWDMPSQEKNTYIHTVHLFYIFFS